MSIPDWPESPDGVRWRLVFLVGVGVGLTPQLLLYPVIYLYTLAYLLFDLSLPPERFGGPVGLWGLPLLHLILAAFAASWVARRTGTGAVSHGLLIALVSVVVGQFVALYYGPLYPEEVARYLALALAGGLLGGLEGRNALAGQNALYEASRSISAARDSQEVVDAVEKDRGIFRIGGAALWWAETTSEESSLSERRPWTSRGWPSGLEDAGLPALAGAGAPRALRAGELPVGGRAEGRERGFGTVLLVPLAAPGERGTGLLAVVSRKSRFPRNTVRVCQTLGSQAALVLENLRLVEEARQAGMLKERQRVAHEIHDTLAQGFTSIVMNLEAAEGAMLPGSRRAREHVEQARQTARESLTEARRLVWALRPESLEDASISEALGRLTERWSSESGVAVGFSVTGTQRPLPAGIEATLFRVAQEALANVRKHARASRVALTLSFMGPTVALDVRDDGIGFDAGRAVGERGPYSGGFGLKGIRERVESLGGTFSVEGVPGEGTTLGIELPATGGETAGVEDRSPETVGGTS